MYFQAIIDEADVDGNGLIDYTEFFALMIQILIKKWEIEMRELKRLLLGVECWCASLLSITVRSSLTIDWDYWELHILRQIAWRRELPERGMDMRIQIGFKMNDSSQDPLFGGKI